MAQHQLGTTRALRAVMAPCAPKPPPFYPHSHSPLNLPRLSAPNLRPSSLLQPHTSTSPPLLEPHTSTLNLHLFSINSPPLISTLHPSFPLFPQPLIPLRSSLRRQHQPAMYHLQRAMASVYQQRFSNGASPVNDRGNEIAALRIPAFI